MSGKVQLRKAFKAILKELTEEAMWHFFKRKEGITVDKVIRGTLNEETNKSVNELLKTVQVKRRELDESHHASTYIKGLH